MINNVVKSPAIASQDVAWGASFRAGALSIFGHGPASRGLAGKQRLKAGARDQRFPADFHPLQTPIGKAGKDCRSAEA